MAPEVITSKRYDEAADIYSFGIMLWELISRDVPYADVQGGPPMAVVSQLINKVVRKGERPAVPAGCPEPLAVLVRACWDQNPKARPPFKSVLEQLQGMRDLPKALVPWVNCSYCQEQARG
jgi:serine/threonine protein kinase